MSVMNLAGADPDDRSVKGIIRKAAARGREIKREVTTSESEPLRDDRGDVLAHAATIGDLPIVREHVSTILQTVRKRFLARGTVLAGILHQAATYLEVLLPGLTPEARRDIRATLFLAARGLENVPAETVVDVANGMERMEAEEPPLLLKQLIGLFVIVGRAGMSRIPEPENARADAAALALWRLARSNEDPDDVETAWDLAVYHEDRLIPADPVPFTRAG